MSRLWGPPFTVAPIKARKKIFEKRINNFIYLDNSKNSKNSKIVKEEFKKL